MAIHPSAIVHPNTSIASDVEIGPFCVVDADVQIGAGCRLEARVSIKQGTIIGESNNFFDGCVIGGMPQHLAAQTIEGSVEIGSGNTFRENVTIHRSMSCETATIVGDNNFLMVNSHVAHDCHVGNHNTIVNNTMLGGHVSVGDRVNIGGGTGVHQFCRIGSYAMVGGMSVITQDVPPYMLIDGRTSRVVGLNLVGLRRAGLGADEIKLLKEGFQILYHRDLTWREILKTMDDRAIETKSKHLAEMSRFLATTTRGIVSERRATEHRAISRHDSFSGETTGVPTPALMPRTGDEETIHLRVRAG
ncbi:MAG: acyl-ACP--UDP-N-acetylglucosamine O-acyltransferase [Thermoguttaceae bacterium]